MKIENVKKNRNKNSTVLAFLIKKSGNVDLQNIEA